VALLDDAIDARLQRYPYHVPRKALRRVEIRPHVFHPPLASTVHMADIPARPRPARSAPSLTPSPPPEAPEPSLAGSASTALLSAAVGSQMPGPVRSIIKSHVYAPEADVTNEALGRTVESGVQKTLTAGGMSPTTAAPIAGSIGMMAWLMPGTFSKVVWSAVKGTRAGKSLESALGEFMNSPRMRLLAQKVARVRETVSPIGEVSTRATQLSRAPGHPYHGYSTGPLNAPQTGAPLTGSRRLAMTGSLEPHWQEKQAAEDYSRALAGDTGTKAVQEAEETFWDKLGDFLPEAEEVMNEMPK